MSNPLAQTTSHPVGLKITRASGDFLYDDTGKAYLDFIAGVGVNNLGHGQDRVNQAMQQQLEKHSHVMVYGEYEQSSVHAFAEKLLSYLPHPLQAVYPLNSGTEANEAALKLARRVTGRTEVIAFEGAYHGNTLGSMSLSHNENRKYPFRPLLPGIRFIRLNEMADLDRITEQSAAVFLETIQGDAGVRIPEYEFMQALRKRCSDTGALLVLDEVQCGLGRTGKFSAFEHFDVVPDVLTLGKALGAGMPIGALVSSKEYLQQFTHSPELGHITTFGGHPVISAAALAGLQVLEEKKVIDQVEEKGQFLEDQLSKHPHVKAFRRKGLLIAIELAHAEAVTEMIESCRASGVLLFWFLSLRNGFRIAPPLTISLENLEQGCKIIRQQLDKLKA